MFLSKSGSYVSQSLSFNRKSFFDSTPEYPIPAIPNTRYTQNPEYPHLILGETGIGYRGNFVPEYPTVVREIWASVILAPIRKQLD